MINGAIKVVQTDATGWMKYSVVGELGSSEGLETYQSGGKECEWGQKYDPTLIGVRSLM